MLIAAAALARTGPVPGRTLEMIEGAHEAVLANVSFPGRTGGNLVLRACAACDPIVLTVDASTVYENSTGPVPLPELNELVDRLRQSSDGGRTAVTVFYALGSSRATRSVVHAGGPDG